MTTKLMAGGVVCLFGVLAASDASAAGNYTSTDGFTVLDNDTGLMWQQTYASMASWALALEYCENLELAGYTDWRLPNIKELQSIVDDSKFNCAIDQGYFDCACPTTYPTWTSTTRAANTSQAWVVYFYSGRTDYYGKLGSSSYVEYARCVRGGQ